MLPETLQYPAAYYAGHACLFERAKTFSTTYFGGPLPHSFKFSGVSFGTRPLHHVMKLYWDTLPDIEKKGFSELVLFYGFRYGGCKMKYEILEPELDFDAIEDRVASGRGFPKLSSECRVLEMEPRQSSEDWPYLGYPDLLPYAPLQVAERIQCSPEDFQGLIVHGAEVNPEELTVVVPAMYDLGISLFGHSADAAVLQLVFRCNLENQILSVRV